MREEEKIEHFSLLDMKVLENLTFVLCECVLQAIVLQAIYIYLSIYLYGRFLTYPKWNDFPVSSLVLDQLSVLSSQSVCLANTEQSRAEENRLCD